jgi:AP-1 complex subunit gamma-1
MNLKLKNNLSLFFFFFKAGNSVRDDIVSSLIGIISSSPDLHGYTAKQLYKIIRDDITQQPLVQVALWTLGYLIELLFFY